MSFLFKVAHAHALALPSALNSNLIYFGLRLYTGPHQNAFLSFRGRLEQWLEAERGPIELIRGGVACAPYGCVVFLNLYSICIPVRELFTCVMYDCNKALVLIKVSSIEKQSTVLIKKAKKTTLFMNDKKAIT